MKLRIQKRLKRTVAVVVPIIVLLLVLFCANTVMASEITESSELITEEDTDCSVGDVEETEDTENDEEDEEGENGDDEMPVNLSDSYRIFFLTDGGETESYTTTYTGSALEPDIVVKNFEDGTTLENGTDYSVSYSENNQVGTATVNVNGMNNFTGSISASFKISLAQPSISSLTPFYNGITIKWSKVKGAEKYVIYRSSKKNSGYKAIATITGNSTFSYKNTGLTTGKTWYYKVRAYSGSSYSQSSAKSKRVQPARATISKIVSKGYNSVQVTWEKASGATGYYLYRSTSKDGTYKKVATITDGSTVSCKDTGLISGKTYYYKVCAYRKVSGTKYSGSKSEVVSGKAVPGKVSVTECSHSSGNVKLSWKKVSGASGYVIYRSTSSSDGFKKVKTVSSATMSWKNTGLTRGKTYYYKIRAYRTVNEKRVYGTCSSVNSVKVPLNKWDKLLNKYKSDSSVNQLIFVKYKGGSKATVYLYDKNNGKWSQVLKCSAYVGKKGIGKTKEGDKKTPTGTYNITGAFGIKSKPTTSLSYTKVNKYLYLCTDKKYYNQLIDIREHPHTCSGEHLINYTGAYNYGLFLDYNSDNVYNKGSAIFMHCFSSCKYTSGCIAVSETNMVTILSYLEDGAKICIYSE